ncbi:glycine-rich protein, partial [Anaerocaecibacter muris]
MSKNKAKTKAENRAKRLLIAIVSAFIAIAIGATCALWFGNSAKPVSVNGATGDVSTSTTYNNKEGNVTGLALKKDDVFNYSYVNNKVYNLTLPAGTYRLTVNGASGGGGYQNGAFSAGLGQGGQTAGDLTLTATTTLYIVVGGKGADGKINTWQASSIAAGGYNGGGNSGQETNSDKNDEGGGGGGATHIALVSGILRNLSSAANKDKVLIVGGGGGGTSFTRTAGKGYGGGGNGGVGYGGTAAPGGGTQTAGGAGGRSNEGTASNGTVGGFGYGG